MRHVDSPLGAHHAPVTEAATTFAPAASAPVTRSACVRRRKEIKVACELWRVRLNDIVPVSMELIAFETDVIHFLIGHFAARGIFPTVQPAGHFQSSGRGCFGNELHDPFRSPAMVPHASLKR